MKRSIAVVNNELRILPVVFYEITLLSIVQGIPLDRAIAALLVAEIQRTEEVTIEGYELLDRIGEYLSA